MLHTPPANRKPVWRSKVDRLCKVEAVVEAGVVGVRVDDYNVAGLLDHLLNLYNNF